MSARIHSIGIAVPARRVSQKEALVHAQVRSGATDRQMRVLERTYLRSGIESRHTVRTDAISVSPNGAIGRVTSATTAQRMREYNTFANDLAAEACEAALARQSMDAGRITHLVTASCTGFAAPGFDIALFDRLGLPRTVKRTHVGYMGCHGALNALRVARAVLGADRDATVLLSCVELCTLHLSDGWNRDRIVANSLFADGAGAAVLRRADESDDHDDWLVLDDASSVLPDTTDAMTWTIGNHGFEMTLSARVPEVIKTALPGFLRTWLDRRALGIDDIAGWAVHPGGPRVLDAVESGLNLPADALAVSREVLRDFGNVSSVTLLIILDALRRPRRPGPTVALAFGPGLTIEAALLR